MELRYLRSFEAIVRCGGFTRAATDLHLAQPVVSAHIKRLELELGVTLLHRARPVSLSAAGESFLPYVRRALASLDEGERAVRAFRSVSVGHVRVAATSLLGGFDLVSTIGRFRLRYPGVTVSLRTGLIADLLEELHRGRVDVVVGPVVEHWEQEGTRRTEIADERLVLISPLSTARRVRSLADVADEPFVCLSSDSGLRRLLNTAFSAVDAVPRVEFETHSPASIREMVAAGLGCALIAQSAVEKEGPDVQVYDIPGLPPHPPIAAISASDAAPPIARFVDELTAARSASRTAGAPASA
ncbi:MULTISPECIES: LysR family transcriptional regulator [Actinomyces]|uniref:LysR family transcriptional regulator n=1 Tax=Actinomyces oris TaxID=544580 RepID=A0A1Q8VIQ6_9ACTO|nr:LysR family transcriptional regulator [Actinomyces oris]OLO47961.1 LysR family transcriptional regulator [Actinomyces oris]